MGGRGSEIVPFDRVIMIFYSLSIVTIALSLTVRPEFAIECLRCSIAQINGGHFGSKVWVFGDPNITYLFLREHGVLLGIDT